MTPFRSRLPAFFSVVLALLVSLGLAAPANAAPPLPDRPDRYVSNPEEAISSEEQKQVEDQLAGVNASHKEKVYVYVIRSLDGQALGNVAADLSMKWKLKPADVLLMASTEDGAVRVHVGSQSRASLGDDKAREIAQRMLDSMTSGQTRVAIMSAITSVFYELEGVDPLDGADHDHDLDVPVPGDDETDAGEIILLVIMGLAAVGLAFGLGMTFARRRVANAQPTEQPKKKSEQPKDAPQDGAKNDPESPTEP